MNYLTKPLKLTCLISAIAVSSVISHASAQAVNHAFIHLSPNQLNAFPSGTGNSVEKALLIKTDSMTSLYSKPLLTIANSKPAEYIPEQLANKNELYQMASIFNDKLQQLIANFNRPIIATANANELDEDIQDSAKPSNKTCKVSG